MKKVQECTDGLDMWLYCLKHAHEMSELPAGFKGTIQERVFGVLEYINLSKEEQTMYDQDLKRKWDNEAVQANSREEGIEIGKAEGIELGKTEGIEIGKSEEKLEIAKNLKATSLPLIEIAKVTGLNIEDIENI